MEDDKFKSLFSDFKPELSDDFRFMKKLEQSLDSVEIIKQHTAEVRTRSKKAVVIAAFVGFVVGFLFSLSLPYLSNVVANWQVTLPADSLMNAFADNFMTIAWIVIGATSVFIALNAYDLSLSLLKQKGKSE